MENEILKEIRELKAFQEKKFDEVDSKIQKLDEKVNQLDKKIDKVEREIINEYKSFVNTVDTVNKREIKKIENKVNENTDNFDAYKEKVKEGIQLFEKAVG